MRRWQMALGALLVAGLALGLTGLVSARDGGAAQGGKDRAFFSVLTGAKEVDSTGRRGAGDPNGRGSFSATLDRRTLCYGIQVKNISDPVAAHIHRGNRSVAGPIAQALEHPTSGDPGASGACVRVTRSLARELRSKPGRYYVNVHTPDYPNGAVRGQLFARSR